MTGNLKMIRYQTLDVYRKLTSECFTLNTSNSLHYEDRYSFFNTLSSKYLTAIHSRKFKERPGVYGDSTSLTSSTSTSR